jgi:hypothetical protein
MVSTATPMNMSRLQGSLWLEPLMNMHCSETSSLLYTNAWKNDETYSLRPNGERMDEELV